MRIRDLIGKRFCKLLVIRDLGSRQTGKRKYRWWLCQCDCGNHAEIRSTHLLSGQTGCGCGQKLPEGESAFNSLLDTYKRNARTRGLSFRLTKEQFRSITGEPCFYCKAGPSAIIERPRQNGIYVYNGIDRVDNTKGYSVSNCVPCCKICNWMKNDMDQKEFLTHVHKMTTVTTIS